MAFDRKARREIMDPTPVSVPIRLQQQKGMNEAIRRIIESREVAKEAMRAGKETFAEANDFDVGDDAPDFSSPHEEIYDPVDEEVLTRLENDEYAARVAARLEQLGKLVKGRHHGKGSTKSKQSGVGYGDKRVGQSDKVQQGKSKQKSAADDKGSVSEADSDAGDVEE